MGEDLERGMVPAEVFNDESVYRRELRQIFGRCWGYIGHVSEIPNNGDYHVRRIGEDPFIFVRDEEGQIRVMLNNCRLLGSTVCRTTQATPPTSGAPITPEPTRRTAPWWAFRPGRAATGSSTSGSGA